MLVFADGLVAIREPQSAAHPEMYDEHRITFESHLEILRAPLDPHDSPPNTGSSNAPGVHRLAKHRGADVGRDQRAADQGAFEAEAKDLDLR